MNCDQVFEVLTAGPFSRHDGRSADVESHLQACHECRCFAEALRPAVQLIHEAIRDDERLPVFHGLAADRWRAAAAEDAAAEHEPPATAVRRQRLAIPVSLAAWVFAASLVAVIAIGAVAKVSRPSAEFAAGDGSRWMSARGANSVHFAALDRRQLAALSLPVECFRAAVGGARVEPACCTKCHAAGTATPAAAAPVSDDLLKSCSLCHLAER